MHAHIVDRGGNVLEEDSASCASGFICMQSDPIAQRGLAGYTSGYFQVVRLCNRVIDPDWLYIGGCPVVQWG